MTAHSDEPAARAAFDKRAILQNHALFGALGSGVIDQLSAHAASKRIKRGTTIFSKGDQGTCLYAVCSGQVKITVPSGEGKDAVFNLIGPGQIFGEIALLDGGQRTADAVAAKDCELLVIDRRDFIPLVHREPDIAIKLIEILCRRLRNTSEQVEDVIFLDLPARLAKALLRLAGTDARNHKVLHYPERAWTDHRGFARSHQSPAARLGKEQLGETRVRRRGVAGSRIHRRRSIATSLPRQS